MRKIMTVNLKDWNQQSTKNLCQFCTVPAVTKPSCNWSNQANAVTIILFYEISFLWNLLGKIISLQLQLPKNWIPWSNKLSHVNWPCCGTWNIGSYHVAYIGHIIALTSCIYYLDNPPYAWSVTSWLCLLPLAQNDPTSVFCIQLLFCTTHL